VTTVTGRNPAPLASRDGDVAPLFAISSLCARRDPRRHFVPHNAPAKLRTSSIRALAKGERNPKIVRQLQRTLGRWSSRLVEFLSLEAEAIGATIQKSADRE